jgi:plastocyanin
MRNAVLSVAILSLTFAGCGGNGGTPPPPPPVFTSLRISPTSAALVDGDTLQMSATPLDQNGAAMTGLGQPTFQLVSGTAVSVSQNGQVIAQQPGTAQVRASLTSGTTTHTATADANVTALGTTADVSASGGGQTFSPADVKIAVNGTVTWTFTEGANAPHNVTFATPPPAGNIGNTSTGSVSRTFPSAGRFPYQCTRHGGMTGTVTVRTP